MRLSALERGAIREAVHKLDPDARILLYGSRSKSELRGGDIDLLVISEVLGFHDKISLLIAIKEKIGEQRIDLSIKTADGAAADAFFGPILNEAIEL